jgi:hypothetical protein
MNSNLIGFGVGKTRGDTDGLCSYDVTMRLSHVAFTGDPRIQVRRLVRASKKPQVTMMVGLEQRCGGELHLTGVLREVTKGSTIPGHVPGHVSRTMNDTRVCVVCSLTFSLALSP